MHMLEGRSPVSYEWLDALPTCPLCGMYSEPHDKTLTGSICNLQKPFLRWAAHARIGWRRSWIEARYAKIRRDEARARIERWDENK